jgi:YihY family inner membrane protein
MNVIERTTRRIDAFQQRRAALAFPIAVSKKFGDDRAGYLAALIAYYAFASIFPLLIAFVSILGLVLQNSPSLEHTLVNGTLAQFPVIGTAIKHHAVPASVTAIVVSSILSIWAGLGVISAMQNAMNDVWDVPLKDRPNFIFNRLRSLLMLAVFGVLTLATIFLSGLGSTSGSIGGVLRAVGFVGSLVLNWILYMIGFRVLTRKKLSWGDVFPGAVVGAVLWTALQSFGNYLVTHQIARASNTYGVFATVIGLLFWLYMGAQLSLYAAEINVVRVKRLWPRSLVQPPLSEGDKRSFEHEAQVEVRREEQQVSVSFDERADRLPEEETSSEETPRATSGDR